jgi:hypothetical protein
MYFIICQHCQWYLLSEIHNKYFLASMYVTPEFCVFLFAIYRARIFSSTSNAKVLRIQTLTSNKPGDKMAVRNFQNAECHVVVTLDEQ